MKSEQESLDDLKHEHKNEILDLGDDKLKEDLNTMLEDTEFAIVSSTEKQQQIIDSMLNSVVGKYQDAFNKINQIIGNTGWVGSDEFNQNQSELGTQSGAQSQKDNATQNQSNIGSSSTANDTITDKIDNNSDYNHNVEQEILSPENTSNRKVAEIKLSPTVVSIEEGKTTSINVTIRPNDAKNKSLHWSSSNTSVASVSGGTITAVSPGSCIITASTTDESGLSANVSVNVTAKPLPPQPTPPSNTTPESNVDGTGDGIPRVGDKVTFVNGKYYYDSQGIRPVGSKYLGHSVYITKINNKSWATKPIHISTGSSIGNGDLGWLTKEQLSGYATGTRSVDSDIELAKIDEQGKELRIKRGGDKYDIFQYGDGVVPKNLTDNLFTLAQHTNELMSNLSSSKLINNVEINQNYDSLLTVNGDVDKNALPRLEEIIRLSCDYTVDHINTELKKNGFRR